MTLNRYVNIDGLPHEITISDEKTALLDAAASGRAVLAICSAKNTLTRSECGSPGSSACIKGRPSEYTQAYDYEDLFFARYAAESWEDITDDYLERIVRRHLGLPWIICGSSRLLIREWTLEDTNTALLPPGDVFHDPDKVKAYIKCQYGFFEYGLWAVVDKNTLDLVGRCGITNLELSPDETVQELGFEIFMPYRCRGYGFEACQAVAGYAREELGLLTLCGRAASSNEASLRLINKLGFRPVQIDNEEMQGCCLFVWNLQ